MELSFDKYHGIGNDFLVVEAESKEKMPIERAMQLCRRHFGVGGDGVLLLTPGQSEGARATMTVINADGSVPEMCGNGLRCLALHLSRQSGAERESFLVDTGAGALQCDVERRGDTGSVGTEIGKGTRIGTLDAHFAGESYHFHRIETGNPHAICFREQIDDTLLDQLGPHVSGSIESGANVEIATVISRSAITVTVWERGVGRTLACGTGAAATAIAAAQGGLVDYDAPIEVTLPGGPLSITVSQDHQAYLKGPAAWVFSGKTS